MQVEHGAKLSRGPEMTTRGYYSLIQFVPDPGRQEGANVGVVVVCEERAEIVVRMSDNNEAVKRRFTARSFDAARLNIAKDALRGRLVTDLANEPTLTRLNHVRAVEANALVLSEPRAVAVSLDAAYAAEQLFRELVHVDAIKRQRARAPRMTWLLRFLETENVPIYRPGEVTVPVTGEPLPVAFSYVNGACHHVHPQGFSSSREAAIERAQSVGAQGRLLHVHSQDRAIPDRLVVFAKLQSGEHADTIREILGDMNVRMVREEEEQAFAAEIKEQAHESELFAR